MTDTTADAVVIGAGVIGSSIALELTRAGRQVVVVDKGPGAGTGSTSASSACVRFHYSTWEGVVTSWEAKHGWEQWREHLGADDPSGLARYIRTGVLVLDFPGFDTARVLDLFRKVGIPAEHLTADDLLARFPYLDPGRHYPPKSLADDAFWLDAPDQLGALFTPEGGYVSDPQLAAHNLCHAAQVHGASTRFNVQVRRVLRSETAITGVELSAGDRISTPVVVNAAGPHSAIVNAMAGVQDEFKVRTRPLRQEVHHVPSVPATDAIPMVADGDLGTYLRGQPGGGLLVGGQEPACDELVWLSDPDHYDAGPTAAVYEAQVTRAARRIPDLTVAPRPRGIVGVYDVSDDWIPIYDRTSIDGYYVAIGTSGNQFKNAPVVGAMLTRIIEACEHGADHDVAPVVWRAPITNLDVDLGHYSRLRQPNPESSYSVMG